VSTPIEEGTEGVPIDPAPNLPAAGAAAPGRPNVVRRLLRDPSALTGAIIIVLLVLICAVGPFLTGQDPIKQNLADALQGPSPQHWLGTDGFGRDVLTRLMYGGRYSISLGVVSVLLGILIGLPIGAISGFYGGKVDTVVQRVTEVIISFPGILLALALVAALGVGLINVVVAVTISSIPVFIRLARASALTIRELPFVEAAKSLGSSRMRAVFVHVIPNSIAPIVVQGSLQVGLTILTAAGLGFLGLGVPPPDPEWGTMLGEARNFIFRTPLLSVYPGLAIFIVVVAFNLLGDGLRSVLNPRDSR
jgi:ABC-type dipeptide/oligopeptide/nickel transport system permease subunit